MLIRLQAMAQRIRHACWQSGGECGWCCGCCCLRHGANGGGGGGSGDGNSSCGSRRAGLCCAWLSSLVFGWDWLPLATSPGESERPAQRLGGSVVADSQRHALSSGVLSGRASGVTVSGGGRIGGGGGGGGGGADVTGMRRLASSSAAGSTGGGSGIGGGGEDVKPLLTHSVSAEFREKERRFVKGRFVMPGSDVQRRIADAMAGMLKAGGGAKKGVDASGAGAVGGALGRAIVPDRVDSSGEGYRVVSDQDSPAIGEGGGDEALSVNMDCSGGGGEGIMCRTSSSSTSLASPTGGVRETGGTSGAFSRWNRSPRRGTPREEPGRFSRGSVREQQREEAEEEDDDERECVICMEEFSKADPEMLTLCSCGVNKTFFHYSCLLQWLSKHSYCPACREYLYFEERRASNSPSAADRQGHTGSGNRSGRVSATRPNSAAKTAAALRAGLGSCSSPRDERATGHS